MVCLIVAGNSNVYYVLTKLADILWFKIFFSCDVLLCEIMLMVKQAYNINFLLYFDIHEFYVLFKYYQ